METASSWAPIALTVLGGQAVVMLQERSARRRGHWRAEARASYRRRRRPKEVAHEELRERNRNVFIRDGKPNLVEAGGVGRIAICARGGRYV